MKGMMTDGTAITTCTNSARRGMKEKMDKRKVKQREAR